MKFLGLTWIITCLVFVLVLVNIVDANASRRPFKTQLNALTIVMAPLNVMTHLGTPQWLTASLATSGILRHPSPLLFPNVETLRAAYPIIRQEALAAVEASKSIQRDMFFTTIADDGWKRFYIKWYGPPDPLAVKTCPRTVELLQTMPEVHLGMFSILLPGSRIPHHFGPARMCLRYHMGISVPAPGKDCFIVVRGDQYHWRDGEDVMFDDTMTHHVANNSDQTRVVLFLDIERPQTPFFKPLTRAVIQNIGPLTTRANDDNEQREQPTQHPDKIQS